MLIFRSIVELSRISLLIVAIRFKLFTLRWCCFRHNRRRIICLFSSHCWIYVKDQTDNFLCLRVGCILEFRHNSIRIVFIKWVYQNPVLLLRRIALFIIAIVSEVVPRLGPAQNSCLSFVSFELGNVRESIELKLLDYGSRIASRIDSYLIVVVDKFIIAIICQAQLQLC